MKTAHYERSLILLGTLAFFDYNLVFLALGGFLEKWSGIFLAGLLFVSGVGSWSLASVLALQGYTLRDVLRVGVRLLAVGIIGVMYASAATVAISWSAAWIKTGFEIIASVAVGLIGASFLAERRLKEFFGEKIAAISRGRIASLSQVIGLLLIQPYVYAAALWYVAAFAQPLLLAALIVAVAHYTAVLVKKHTGLLLEMCIAPITFIAIVTVSNPTAMAAAAAHYAPTFLMAMLVGHSTIVAILVLGALRKPLAELPETVKRDLYKAGGVVILVVATTISPAREYSLLLTFLLTALIALLNGKFDDTGRTKTT